MTPLLNMLVPTYTQMLGTLLAWLDKAEAQRPGNAAKALLSARLTPDMFPLSTQIRFACAQAQEGVYRLCGENVPETVVELLDEGRNGSERPGSLSDARARISETLVIVKTAATRLSEPAAEAAVAHVLPTGLVFDFSAEQYARDWALPQFYFHIMTAYAILRAQGVKLGKIDYVAHLLGFVRPGTMPPR